MLAPQRLLHALNTLLGSKPAGQKNEIRHQDHLSHYSQPAYNRSIFISTRRLQVFKCISMTTPFFDPVRRKSWQKVVNTVKTQTRLY